MLGSLRPCSFPEAGGSAGSSPAGSLPYILVTSLSPSCCPTVPSPPGFPGRMGGDDDFIPGWGRRCLRQGGRPWPPLGRARRHHREVTSVTDAAEVAGPLTVLLQVVCHVGRPQVLPAHLAGYLVFVAGQVGAQPVPRGKGGIASLWAERRRGEARAGKARPGPEGRRGL